MSNCVHHGVLESQHFLIPMSIIVVRPSTFSANVGFQFTGNNTSSMGMQVVCTKRNEHAQEMQLAQRTAAKLGTHKVIVLTHFNFVVTSINLSQFPD